MTTDLALATDTSPVTSTADPTGGRLVAWAEAASAAHQLATALCRTAFVPKAFANNAGDATAALLLGDELGLSPIAALRSIYVVSGTPALYARAMVALVLAHGHQMWTVEESEQRVTVAGRRRGSDKVEQVTWTIDRARKAGYTSNKKYQSDPVAMLYARASGDVARRIAPDVLSGVPYSAEEIELGQEPTKVTVTRTPAASAKVSRKKPEPEPTAEPKPEPELDAEPAPEQAAEPEPADSTDDKPSEKQLNYMFALLKDNDLADRDAALGFVGGVIGHDIASRSELTAAEVSQVIDALNAGADQ